MDLNPPSLSRSVRLESLPRQYRVSCDLSDRESSSRPANSLPFCLSKKA